MTHTVLPLTDLVHRARSYVTGALFLIAFLLTAVTLSACDAPPDIEGLLAKARAAAAAGDYSTAIIEYKNTLQAEPENAQTRWQLGQIYLDLSQPAAAFKEFEKAAALGMESEDLTLAMLQARLNLGQFEELLKELPGAALTSSPDTLLVMRAEAQLGLRDMKGAKNTFERVLETDPDSAGAHRGLAKIGLATGDHELAQVHLDAATQLDKGNAESQFLKAELAMTTNEFEIAEAAFRKAQALTKGAPNPTLGLARSLLAQNRAEEAKTQLEVLHRAAPGAATVNYFRAVAAYQLGDTDSAFVSLRDVLQVRPNHPQALFLIGSLSYDKREFRQAEDYLSRFLSISPDNIAARKLLATVHLALDQNKEAASTLEPVVNDSTQDPQLVAMLGSAYLGLRDAKRGSDLLERAAALAPGAAAIRTQLALSQLLDGSSQKAIASLEQAVKLNPNFDRADLLLIFTHLRNRDWDKAIAAGEALIAKQKDAPIPLNLVGAAYVGKENLDRAREYYQRALDADENFVNAALNIAALDVQLNRLDEARKRYEAILAKNLFKI
ncbi:MAG: PEP-CTERM system TPR-repeat protein PrsT [Gammaproteobacteria bacterium]|nr:PEP-CTERM system TPR-repeat protein PrsT [Gammaproteobacteria bacterium]